MKAYHYILVIALALTSCKNDTTGFYVKQTVLFGEASERSASIDIGDVDSDMDTDIVVANGRHWKEKNLVLINSGKGIFSSPLPLAEDGDPSYAAELADFDLDGDLDIAIGNDRSPNVIYVNDGKGNYSRGGSFGAASSNTRNLTISDIDKDGDMDILVANRGQQNEICLNDGKGNFTKTLGFGTDKDSTIDIEVADVDGDEDNDLILANLDFQSNYVYINDGSLNFTKKIPFGTGKDNTRSIAVADFDNDGFLDIATANLMRPNIVYFGNKNQEYSRSIVFDTTNNVSFSVAVQDLNNDGNPDLLIANEGETNAVFLNEENGKLWNKIILSKARYDTYDILSADLDGDGIYDIIESNSDAPNMYYLIARSKRDEQERIYKSLTFDPPERLNPEWLEKCAGIYFNSKDSISVIVEQRDSLLYARMGYEIYAPLTPLKAFNFTFDDGKIKIDFTPEKDMVHFENVKFNTTLERLTYLEEDLNQFVGVYEFIQNPKETISIRVNNDGLLITASLQGEQKDYSAKAYEKGKFSGLMADLIFKNNNEQLTIQWAEAVFPFEYKRKSKQ